MKDSQGCNFIHKGYSFVFAFLSFYFTLEEVNFYGCEEPGYFEGKFGDSDVLG